SFRRLAYRVLEHDPTQKDVRSFLADFKTSLVGRGLSLRGVTTDGSSLYPEPLPELVRQRGNQCAGGPIRKRFLAGPLPAEHGRELRIAVLAGQHPALPARGHPV